MPPPGQQRRRRGFASWLTRGGPSWQSVGIPEPSVQPSPHLVLVDGTRFNLTAHASRLVSVSAGTEVLVDGAPSLSTLAMVALFPVGRYDAGTDEAMRHLSERAEHCDRVNTVLPLVLVWCVPAAQRIMALLPHHNGTEWGNQISISTAGGWGDVRSRHPTEESALTEIDHRMAGMFLAGSHTTAIGGNTRRALHYVDRIAHGRSHFVLLAECFSGSDRWHGHEMLAAAVRDLVPGAPSAQAESAVHAESCRSQESGLSHANLEGWGRL